MKDRWSTRSRLAVGALAVLVAVVAVLGTWQVVAARSSQRTEVEDGELNAAHLASSALGSALKSRLQLLSNLAANAELAPIFTKGTPAQLSKLAATLHLVYPGFASFDLIGAKGRLDARWPQAAGVVGKSVLDQPSLAAALRTGQPSVSQGVQQSVAPKELVVLLAAPVRDKAGRVAGMITASLPSSSLGALVGGVRLRDDATLVVFDQDGHALTGPASGDKVTYSSVTAVGRALGGRSGALIGQAPGYGQDHVIGYAPVLSTGWVVLVEQPMSQLNAQAAALTERLGAIGVVVLLLAAGTVWFLGSLLGSLARERQRAGALVASVGEGVIAVGSDGTLQLANPAMGQLTGLPLSSLVGRHWSDALSLVDTDGSPQAWEESIAAQAAREQQVVATTGYELQLNHVDGRRVPVAMTAAPLLADDGEVLGTVVVLRDVSREREVDQLKSSLVSTVSHELRTPLTMVQGFAELLVTRSGELGPDRAREAAGQILSSAQRLGRLIDDLLSVSRIDSGKLRVDIGAVDLAEVLEEVVRVTDSRSAPGEADAVPRLRVEIPSGLPTLMADRDKLVQILVNLVSNALKYSPSDQPVWARAVQRGDYVEIAVSDHGIGLSETERTKVFEKFNRADRAEVRKVGGTGLGLYITKSLVQMQHGRIWVESEIGCGSSFFVAFPTAPATGPGTAKDRNQQLEEVL